MLTQQTQAPMRGESPLERSADSWVWAEEKKSPNEREKKRNWIISDKSRSNRANDFRKRWVKFTRKKKLHISLLYVMQCEKRGEQNKINEKLRREALLRAARNAIGWNFLRSHCQPYSREWELKPPSSELSSRALAIVNIIIVKKFFFLLLRFRSCRKLAQKKVKFTSDFFFRMLAYVKARDFIE